MLNICFLKKYLESKRLKNITINMSGIINIKSEISGFNFKINGNKLKINNSDKEILEIDFNEVEYVKSIENNKIIINFNINEQIIIE